MKSILEITDLSVQIDEIVLVHSIAMTLKEGFFYSLMGPNGAGKSSFLYALMGHPRYAISSGSIVCDGHDITHASPDIRARAGLFLALQQNVAIPGVRVFDFLKEARRALTGQISSVDELYDELCTYMDFLGIDPSFAYRNLNDGFSGGERKRFELLQLLFLKPRIALLDEIDSGLDVAGRRLISDALMIAREQTPSLTLLFVSHYQETINLLPFDHHFFMQKGCINSVQTDISSRKEMCV